ncbi:MAG: hypothetical protein AB8E15_07020 [Bdellovibrionales bacterium]
MTHELICEDFKLSSSIKSSVEENLDFIRSAVSKELFVHIYITEPVKKEFKVLFKTHLFKKELLATGTGSDLYKLITNVRKIFVKNLNEESKKIKSHHR